MVKLKITVIKNFSPEDVFGGKDKIPSDKLTSACTAVKEGQEFFVEKNIEKPEGFCGWAWRDIYKDVSVLWFGGDFPWVGPNVAYTACTDGMRPVCFKLERLES